MTTETTESYEYLLDKPNVLAVDYDTETDTVTVYVSQKIPESELPDDAVIASAVSKAVDSNDHARNKTPETDVQDLGFGEERDAFRPLLLEEWDDDYDPSDVDADSDDGAPIVDAEGFRRSKHRPIEGGVSEINANSTAATGGPYPAVVVNPDAAESSWRTGQKAGELVRLSNCHVYARSGAADFGEKVLQPSPMDGGTPDDTVGDLCGYVPIRDGAVVDVAARSTTPSQESDLYHKINDDLYPDGVFRDTTRPLKGRTVVKTGRTTGTSSGDIISTSASVRVRYGGDLGLVTMRDQLITKAKSAGGDSGSPVFLEESGELVGLLFAGSSSVSIVNKITNVESQLGVRILSSEPTFPDKYAETYRKLAIEYTDERDVNQANLHLLPAEEAADILTPCRLELLQAISDRELMNSLGSITALAEHLDRGRSAVSEDLERLVGADIVRFDTDTSAGKIPRLKQSAVIPEGVIDRTNT